MVSICMNEEFDARIAKKDAYNSEILKKFPKKRELKKSEMSIFAKHLSAIKRISQSTSDKMSLVVEDDIIFEENELDRFIYKHIDHKQEQGESMDWIFVGSGCHTQKTGMGLYEQKGEFKSRCADSYFVKPSEARRFCKHINDRGVTYPFDWELNLFYMLHPVKVFWLEPPITAQGSQNGQFKSSIQEN